MTRALALTIEVGGHEILVHGDYNKGDPGALSGPMEDAREPEDRSFQWTKFELPVHVTDDLSPNPRKLRTINLDITDLVEELGIPQAAIDREVEEIDDESLE